MLLLQVFAAAVLAAIESPTSATSRLAKRSPEPTGPIELEQAGSELPAQTYYTNEELPSTDDLNAAQLLFGKFGVAPPSTKRQRLNPATVAGEPEQLQAITSRGDILGSELQMTRTLQLPTISGPIPVEPTVMHSTESSIPTPLDIYANKVKPSYTMLRNLSTVNEVWQEYKYGLNGNPSIESLDRVYGTNWIGSKENVNFYYKRKPIYDYLKNSIKGKSEKDVVNELESFRVSQKWSISFLQLKIPSLYDDPVTGKPKQSTPTYILLRNLTTVPEIWQEFKYGINGNPSIESLVQMYGRNWFSSASDEKQYYNRKKIYDYIKTIIASGGSESDTVNNLEELRRREKWSIRVLQNLIRKKSLNMNLIQIPLRGIVVSSTQNVTTKSGSQKRRAASTMSKSRKTTQTKYKMMRNLTTVYEVWKEFKFGLNGNPSVESLVQNYGDGWIGYDNDFEFYEGRRKIYDFILNAIANEKSEGDVVKALENVRVSKVWTLQTLQGNVSSLVIDEETGIIRSERPVFTLLRNLTTVPEVWNEYKYGINGNPSVESIMKQYGTSWQSTSAEKSYYKLRKRIYDYVLNATAKDISDKESVNALEGYRVAQKWTLSNLQLNIPSLSIDESTGQIIRVLPSYDLCRNLTTVPQVWEEYKNGINGNPSIESLIQHYKSKWLKTYTERNYFSHRKKIYDYILNAKSEDDAVKELEEYRISNNLSLYSLPDNLPDKSQAALWILPKANSS